MKQIEQLMVVESLISKSFYNVFRNNCVLVTEKLRFILSEIEKKRLIQTSQLLKEAIVLWQQNVNFVEKEQNVDQQVLMLAKQIEISLEELDKIINEEPEIEYPKNVIEKNIELYDKQNTLANETGEFIDSLKQLGRKSFLITLEDINLAVQAQDEMFFSASALNKLEIPQAVQHQNYALNNLLALKNNLATKQQVLQQVAQQVGQPMGSTLQLKNVPGGKTGVLTGRVVLPSAKDYVPPRELREDIIKSLSERYPEELKKIIEKYYKMLLK
jgi:hypothetical protein